MSNLRYASILMSLLTLLAGCGVCESYNGLAAGFLGQPTPVPNSDDLRGFSVSRPVIESPLNNTELPLLPFVISTYAGHPAGAVQAVLLVNGVEVQTIPVVAESDPLRPEIKVMTKIDQTWTPPAAGAYYLQVRVTWANDEGTEITYPVLVYVGGVPTLDFTQIANEFTATAAALTGTVVPTGSPTPTATNTLVASPTVTLTGTRPRITFTPSATPTLTLTPSATTAANAPFTTFSADSTTINVGQCTMLHWTSGNIQSIFLNNQPVTGSENRQVCPPSTTTYTLLAHSASGDISKQVTIQVTNNGAPFTTFTADSTSINAGQCTTLHWTSGNIQSIFLNGQAATGNEDRQVCPTSTTLYQLVAHSASGDITKEITVQVTGSVSASATTPVSAPEFTGHTTSTSIFDNFADCAVSHPHSVTFTVNVTNATQVSMSYQVAGGGSSTIGLSSGGGNTWTVTLTGDTSALPGLPTGTLTYSFSASNASGTTPSASFSDVQYNDCTS